MCNRLASEGRTMHETYVSSCRSGQVGPDELMSGHRSKAKDQMKTSPFILKSCKSPTHKCALLSQVNAWSMCIDGCLVSRLSKVVLLDDARQYSLASSSSFMNTSSWGFSGHFSPLLGGRTAWKRLQSPLHRIQGSTSTLKWSSGENSVLMRLGVPAPFPRVISCPRSL